jgi:hypothetical protein
MSTKIGAGVIETDIYTTEGGYVAIRQTAGDSDAEQVCLLSADQLPQVIRKLQALYYDRKKWEEASVE